MVTRAAVSKSWKRICKWLAENAPSDLSNIRMSGAEAQALKSFESLSGASLPKDFIRLYGLMDGTEGDAAVGVFPSPDDHDDMAYSPLPLEEIAGNWQMEKELFEGGNYTDLEADPDEGVAGQWWHTGWIPFATNGAGDFICVDTAPAEGGTAGQVIAFSHESGARPVLAASLAEYLETLADSLETGVYEYHQDYGIRRASGELDSDDPSRASGADPTVAPATTWVGISFSGKKSGTLIRFLNQTFAMGMQQAMKAWTDQGPGITWGLLSITTGARLDLNNKLNEVLMHADAESVETVFWLSKDGETWETHGREFVTRLVAGSYQWRG
ncbi:MAG: SMI1/KNR4 family protein [Candidatus Melainabacteria bacterium]|nr:SMI1/KNR4 family protein [Candidatus Melainabacteria bacterium]